MTTKHAIPKLSAACTVLFFAVLPLSAATFGKFTYEDNGTSITITGYPESEIGVVNIPAAIAGKPVTSIGNSAFSYCRGLTRMTIPSDVTTIGNYAFESCSNLASMTIPSSVASIGQYAFSDCYRLTSVTIPSRVTSISEGVFSHCNSLTSVKIPSRVTSIGRIAFNACASLTNITIPSSVTSIGDNAFSGCSGLISVAIPSSVTSVGQYAFSGCSGLKSVTIPSSITLIDSYVFGYCSSLTSVTIPPTVTSINFYAFFGCSSLTRVTIPSNVTLIGGYAFSGCSSLTTASFLGNAPIMYVGAFDDAAPGFKVHFITGKSGFFSPTWYGYPCVGLAAVSEIEVEQPVGSSLVDGMAKKSFGTVVVGQSGIIRKFTITNSGTGDLIRLAVSVDGTNAADFLITPLAKTRLAPEESITFTVSFKPIASGTRSAAIHVKSNDSDENPFDIKLTGLGVAP